MSAIGDEFEALYRKVERALVYSGYMQGHKKYADADWKKFANELGQPFLDFVKKSREATTLTTEPPKQLLKMGHIPGWVEVCKDYQTVEDLFLSGICQVRNNVAHGHKYVGTEADKRRDDKLTGQATWVLHRAIERNDKIRAYLAANP